MLQSLAVGVLGSLVGNTLGEALKTKDNGKAAEGFEIAHLGSAKAPDDAKGAYNDSMDATAKEALDALREMTSGGLEGFWKWMMKELREDVMEDMGVSEEALAAMDPAQRAAVEDAIEKEVQARLKEAMGIDDNGTDMAKAKLPEEMIEKLKQAMQTAQGVGYKEDKTLMELLG